jgi:hypothetical protein
VVLRACGAKDWEEGVGVGLEVARMLQVKATEEDWEKGVGVGPGGLDAGSVILLV